LQLLLFLFIVSHEGLHICSFLEQKKDWEFEIKCSKLLYIIEKARGSNHLSVEKLQDANEYDLFHLLFVTREPQNNFFKTVLFTTNRLCEDDIYKNHFQRDRAPYLCFDGQLPMIFVFHLY
jgi:hypothetical protein